MLLFMLVLFTFLSEFKYLLSSLIYLEFLTLIMFVHFILSTYLLVDKMTFAFFYIAVAACEAALGLSATVLYVSKKGTQLFKTF